MRAAVVNRYGPPSVAEMCEVADPVASPGHALVRVHAAAVTAGDARIRGASFPAGMGLGARLALGIRGPRKRVLGATFSGVVEAVGAGLDGISVGDTVAGSSGMAMGAHAELVAAPAERIVPKPAAVSDETAAAVLFGGMTALHFLDAVGVRAGDSVLVVGASGAVGSSAVQLAAHAGARVTGVTSGKNADRVLSLGAEAVVDYTKTPVELLDERFDLVLDTVGSLRAASGKPLLRAGGTLVLVAGDLRDLLTARGRVRAGTAGERPSHMRTLLALAAAGALDPVVHAALPLSEISQAYAIVDSGRKVGNVVVVP